MAVKVGKVQSVQELEKFMNDTDYKHASDGGHVATPVDLTKTVIIIPDITSGGFTIVHVV